MLILVILDSLITYIFKRKYMYSSDKDTLDINTVLYIWFVTQPEINVFSEKKMLTVIVNNVININKTINCLIYWLVLNANVSSISVISWLNKT